MLLTFSFKIKEDEVENNLQIKKRNNKLCCNFLMKSSHC